MPDKEEVIRFLSSYGIPEEILRPYKFIFRSNRCYIYSGGMLPANHVVAGLPVCRFGRTMKPTTVGLQFFQRFVTKRVVELAHDEAVQYIQGYDIGRKAERGYVAVKYSNDILGVGFSDGNRIRNQLPKQRRIQKIDMTP